MDTSEGSLAEDADPFTGRLSGSLIFDETERNGMMKDASVQSFGISFEESSGSAGSRQGPGNVTFDIVDARTVESQRKKYVLYTIAVVSASAVDSCPVKLDRRYSDFDELNSVLKKKFPHEMSNVSFPKKLVVGNFKPETIAQRSRAFEQYLCNLVRLDQIRLSKEFTRFFFGTDQERGYECINNGQYDQAIPLLQRCANIEKKLLGSGNIHVIATLCALVCSYHAVDKDKQAQSVAEAALRCIAGDDHNKHLIPLLQVSIRLCWTLGKDKKDLEARLQSLRDKGLQVQGGKSLLELVVQRFQRR